MKERLSALKVALDNERKERAFYLENAKRTQNPLGKAMFEQIAGDELEHYERLKELHDKWEKQEKWPETVPLKVKNTVVRNIVKDMAQKIGNVPTGDSDDLKAIHTAIEFEAEGIKHYEELSNKVSDPKEREFFGLLATIEREHYLSLKDTEELLTNPATWYQKHERTGLDGA